MSEYCAGCDEVAVEFSTRRCAAIIAMMATRRRRNEQTDST